MHARRLPPGPRAALVSTLRHLRDPYGEAFRLRRRFGDLHTLDIAGTKVVFTGDPAGARQILSADPDTFEAFGVELFGPVIGENQPLLLSGERHRAARKVLAPPFHGARMRAYGETMRAITLAETTRWENGRPFVMHDTTQAISLRIIIQTVFGVSSREREEQFRHVLTDGFRALRPSFLFIPALRRPWWRPWVRFQRARHAVRELVYAEIAERRARGITGEDILSLMLAARYADGRSLTDREIFDQLMNMLAAGHKSTAIALAWACHLVHTHPAVQERLLAEIRALGPASDPEAIARLPYLDAVCQETLRLNPIAPQIVRILARPFTFEGYTLPPGTGVGVSVLLVHRREDLYPEAESFEPERFCGRTFAPFEFLPFGGGARRCLGAAFALYEMKTVLATMLEKYALRSAEHGTVRVVSRGTFVGPRDGIRMVATALVR